MKDGLSFFTLRAPQENERGPKYMEASLSGLSEIFRKIKTSFSLEIFIKERFLHFYLCCPKIYSSLVIGQLSGQHPNLDVQETRDYLEKSSNEEFYGTEIYLKRFDLIPINTYKNLEVDPLSVISGVIAGFSETDKAWIQINLKAINKDFIPFKISYFLRTAIRRSFDIHSAEFKSKLSEVEYQKYLLPLYKTKIRLSCISDNKEKAKVNLQSLVSSFKSISKTELNEFKGGRLTNNQKFIDEYRKRDLSGKSFILNNEEIASIYHFPSASSQIAQIDKLKAKRAEPPVNLPQKNKDEDAEVSLFGETNFRNSKISFGIKRGDRSRHMYLIGKTGMGKTKLLELLILEDLKHGKGVAVLDPHGDLAEELLKFIPEERTDDVIYFNPGDKDYPIGFNPMESVREFEYKQNIVAGFIGIFKKLFGWNWNERLEHVLRYSTLALLDYPNATILGIPRLLSDNLFRQDVISKIEDPLVKKFWTTEFSSWSEDFSNEAIVPIINKVGQFVASPLIRNIVGQSKSVLKMTRVMEEKKILIANLSIGKLGEENSALLGSMLITKIWQSALERASIPESERKDFYLYVDELQNFATNAFANILSEARKYKLCLTVAHQYMKQLPEEVRATIFGNVGSIVSFRVGGEDASILEKEFKPRINAEDLMNLDMRDVYLKMTIDGQTAFPFSAKTINLPKPSDDLYNKIVSASRQNWARPRVEIEKEIEEFTKKEFRGATGTIKVNNEKQPKFSEPIV